MIGKSDLTNLTIIAVMLIFVIPVNMYFIISDAATWLTWISLTLGTISSIISIRILLKKKQDFDAVYKHEYGHGLGYRKDDK